MATAIENGLVDKIELIKDKTDLKKHNPLLKRPALITDDGDCIIDSPVICQYLDTLGDNKVIPAIGPARWKALRAMAGNSCCSRLSDHDSGAHDTTIAVKRATGAVQRTDTHKVLNPSSATAHDRRCLTVRIKPTRPAY